MKPNGFYQKSTAIFLSFCLILLNSLGDVSASTAQTTDSISGRTLIDIPSQFGFIEEYHDASQTPGAAPQTPTVIYIQDAHDSLEAQQNIAGMIQYLVGKHRLKTVYEEGYEGEVPSDEYFGSVRGTGLKEKVSFFLMDQLRISGAEYAHINRKQDFRLIGIDDIRLHLENIAWYRTVSGRREKTLKDLAEIEAAFEKMAQKKFPKAVKEWMRVAGRFEKSENGLLDFLKGTLRLFEGGKIPEGYPVIERILKLDEAKSAPAPDDIKINSKDFFSELHRLQEAAVRRHLVTENDRMISNACGAWTCSGVWRPLK